MEFCKLTVSNNNSRAKITLCSSYLSDSFSVKSKQIDVMNSIAYFMRLDTFDKHLYLNSSVILIAILTFCYV